VAVAAKNDRAGLGDPTAGLAVDAKSKAKAELWMKTRDRFSKSNVSDIFKMADDDDEAGEESVQP
jgi:hypothetical protein